MGQISSINFKKSIPINTEHNDRTLAPNYLIDKEKGAECNRNAEQARALKNQIIKEAIQKYTENTRQKFQAKSFEWSAVVNIKPDTTMRDLENLAKHFNDKYGFQCYQIAIHRDEGHKNTKGEIEINQHAHMEFITLDKETGKQNFKMRDFSKQKMREIQTEVAEILQMERGKDKRLTGTKRIEPRKYAQLKEQEKAAIKETKIKVAKQIKELKTELEAVKLSKKEIKEQFEAFRKENAGQGLAKEFFQKLSEDKKKLLAEPTCTQEQLDAYFIELRESNTTKEKRLFGEKEVIDYEKIIQEQQQTISDLNAKNDNLKQIANKSIEFIDQKVEIDLNAKFDLLKQQNEIQLNEQLENERKKLKKAQLEAEQKQKQASENFNYFLKRSRELRESQAVKEAIAIKDKEIEDIKAKNDQKISELKTENEATKKENIELHNENKDLKTKLTRYKETIKKLWNKYKSLLKDKLKHKEQDFKQTLADNYNSTKKLADEFKKIIPEPKKYRAMWISNDGKAMAREFTQSQYNKLDDELKARCKLIENEPKQQNTKRERKGFER
jgi:hypothetical protein